MNMLTGREDEKEVLKDLLRSDEPELLAIYGRRRVGKTFLIKTFYQDHIVFSCTGEYKANTVTQLSNFNEKLSFWFPRKVQTAAPQTWQQAFILLRDMLLSIKGRRKKVVFFDELPWMDSHKSGFLSAFGYFWNAYAADIPGIIVVVCGSATSWIIDKIVNDKGGLHNRITRRIRLLPFSLKETEQFLLSKNIQYARYELLQLYMVMGGIPAYLNEVKRGKSVAQNIQSICFSKDGLLAGEFNNLYAALFKYPERHIQIISALAKNNKGLTRTKLLSAGKLMSGGTLTKALTELTESGFVEKTYPFDKKEKESLYRLTDEFSLFYFRFIHHQKNLLKDQWLTRLATPQYQSWCGYAFENICIKHIGQIKRALQIGAVQTGVSSWVFAGNRTEKGAQIDLLIDRADRIINICEVKYSNKKFIIDKRYAGELKAKKEVFRMHSRSNKTIHLTMITTYGVKDNDYKMQLADSEVQMEDLFR